MLRIARLVKEGLHAVHHYRRRLAGDAFPGVAVLCYHGVRPRGAPPDGIAFAPLHLPLEEFEEHCRLLRDACNPISLSEWREALAGGRPLPPRAVLLTFDDGYRSFYLRALPVLERFGIPAVVFLCSDAIHGRSLLWYDAIARARSEPEVERMKALPYAQFRAATQLPPAPLSDDDPLAPMSIEEVRSLADSPGIEIGSHTASHLLLARASADEQRAHIELDRVRLGEWCGAPPRAFAYPNGRPHLDYSDETVALVREAGFDFAFTTRPGFARPSEHPLERSRFVMLEGVPAAELGAPPVLRMAALDPRARMAPLRIAITVDPYLPVPPRHYGGIERLIDLLVRGLVDRGHTVSLIGHPESAPPERGELVGYGSPPHWGSWPRASELWQVASALWRRRRRLDVIHSTGRLAALLPVLPLRRLPKIQTYQREHVPWQSVRTASRLAGPSVYFVGCSNSVLAGDRHGPAPWRRIFNAIDVGRYRFRGAVAPDAPLVFLGRIEPIKGTHHAIAIARAAGRRLVIAGNRITTGPDAGYFDRAIAPHVDGEQVRYVGPLDDAAKDELLGGAAALLMPVEWEEPFGMVMIEALACGTPVIGFSRGGVPEVVRDGVTGWLCRTVDEAVAAVGRLDRLDRRAARADCEARFGAAAYVDQHEELYYEMVARCAS